MATKNNIYMKNLIYIIIVFIIAPLLGCDLERLPEPTCAKPPVAAFTPDLSDCEAPCTVSFLNTSVDALSYRWHFGDGDSSLLEKAEHTFTKPGTYAVRLIAEGTNNCVDTMIKTILVSGGVLPPVAYFISNVTECTGGCIVKFTNKSLYANSFTWDFGDGTPPLVNPANIHPTHRFDCSGTFTVILSATGSGITVRDSQIIRIRTELFVRTDDMAGMRDQLLQAFPTPDGGYMAVGYSEGTSFGNPLDGIIGKWDAKGEKQWIKRYDTNNKSDRFDDMAMLPDGGAIVVGDMIAVNGVKKGRVLRVDASGQTLWQKDVDGAASLFAVSDIQDNAFYVIGFTFGMFIGKYDTDGNVMWEKQRFNPGLTTPFPNAIAATPDGGAMVAGWYDTKGNSLESDYDIMLVNFDASGNLRWYNTFGGNGSDAATAVANTRDGGFIVGAQGNKGDNSSLNDFHLLKITASGQKQWAYSYPPENLQKYDAYPSTVIESADGNYYLGGDLDDLASSNIHAILLKVDKDGRKAWQKNLSDNGWCYLNSLQPVSSDCGFVMSGAKGPGELKFMDFMLIKTDRDGNIQ